MLRHGVDLPLGNAGETFGVERLHHAAAGDSTTEDFAFAATEFLGEINQFHPKPRVGFVNAIAVQRFLE